MDFFIVFPFFHFLISFFQQKTFSFYFYFAEGKYEYSIGYKEINLEFRGGKETVDGICSVGCQE